MKFTLDKRSLHNRYHMEIKDQYLTGIDITKFIASMLILMSHTGIISNYNEYYNAIFINGVFRWCVPFFFMASGYFMPLQLKKLLKYCFRIIVLFFIWTMFYVIIKDYSFNLKIFWNGNVPVIFWFFPSLLICVLTTFLLKKIMKNCYVVILLIASVLYLFALLGESYLYILPLHISFDLYSDIFGYTTRNGFLFGTIYVCIGNFLRNFDYTEKVLSRVKLSALMCTIFVLFLYSFLEICIYVNGKTGIDFNATIFSVPLSTSIFLLSLKIKIRKDISLFFRKMSTLIYVLHFYIISLINVSNSILKFITVFLLTSFISAIIVILSKKIKLLTYLY